mmetsp:Transcript_2691/g.7341  ORF Transcript_2691/g.7341 Transcript_2691/m.7341 type:complete len:177 (+) Transcript_2691:494-1024(+)
MRLLKNPGLHQMRPPPVAVGCAQLRDSGRNYRCTRTPVEQIHDVAREATFHTRVMKRARDSVRARAMGELCVGYLGEENIILSRKIVRSAAKKSRKHNQPALSATPCRYGMRPCVCRVRNQQSHRDALRKIRHDVGSLRYDARGNVLQSVLAMELHRCFEVRWMQTSSLVVAVSMV